MHATESRTRLLVLDRDERLAAALSTALRRRGFDVTRVSTTAEALAEEGCDMVLLDPLPTGPDVADVCSSLRNRGDAGIIVMAAGATEQVRVSALWAGADDFVAKPLDLTELHARIEAVLRRRRGQRTQAIGRLEIDPGSRQASVDGQPIPLSHKEFDLLTALVKADGAVLSRIRLTAEVWSVPNLGRSRTLDVHIATLRRKIASAARVENVRGVGYRLEPYDRARC